MPRRLLACLVASLCAAPAAFAAGPDPGVVRGGLGTAAPGGKIRYVATGGKNLAEPANCARAQSRTRSPHDVEPKPVNRVGEQISIAARANQCRTVTMWKKDS